jgi:GGDEF domain-containing protein
VTKSTHKSLNHIIDASNFYIALYDRQNDTIAFPYNVDLVDGALPDIKNADKVLYKAKSNGKNRVESIDLL